MTIRVYGADEVHAALPWDALAHALEAAFVAGDAQAPLRHAHALAGDASLLLMPAWTPQSLGVKLVTVMPGAAVRGLATVQASYLLLDRESGAPLALIDGEALTLRRTAATSALAARPMMRPDARRFLIVGAGRLALWMARAQHALNPRLAQVQVWARRVDAAQALAATLRDEGIEAHAVANLADAVGRADVITCATTSREPLVHGAWLREGTHLDLVGGFRRDMREADDLAAARSRIVVDTFAGALAEAGDLVQPIERGVIPPERVVAELAQVLRGEVVGRTSATEITLFKSVGAAVEDLAAAQLVVSRA
jgi:alanine dehydrogenase